MMDNMLDESNLDELESFISQDITRGYTSHKNIEGWDWHEVIDAHGPLQSQELTMTDIFSAYSTLKGHFILRDTIIQKMFTIPYYVTYIMWTLCLVTLF